MKPERTEAEERELRVALRKLLSKRISRSALEARFGAFETEPAGGCDRLRRPTWEVRSCPAGAARPEKVRFSFKEALSADERLIEALGFEDPVVVSFDVHWSTRDLVERKRFSRPRLRGKRVRVRVDERGLVATDLQGPASMVWLAENPRILELRLTSD